MVQRSAEPFLHPVVWVLLGLIALVALGKHCEPPRDRQRAMRAFGEHLEGARHAKSRASTSGEGGGDLSSTDDSQTLAPNAPFESWYLDDDVDSGVCTFDFSPEGATRLAVHGRGLRLSNGTVVFLSPQDLAFLGWVAYSYRINPHFLLGVMVAESNGNCAAVSYAGAQGCFQITYQQGAGQLRNSFPERVASWYWAPRTNSSGLSRSGDAQKGYWPDDLYIAPEVYFRSPEARGSRQLRMTVDPVATLTTSDVVGDVEVSSVANFSFGVVGSGLYFHYLNHYLYSHADQVGEAIRDLVSEPGAKAWWMAAAYNQGGPRTMSTLGKWGADEMWRHTADPVVQYAATVADYCEQLQGGLETYGGTMTYGNLADFLEQLRWTYSEVPIDWDRVRQQVRAHHFTAQTTIDLEAELPAVFRTMVEADPHLAAEEPVLDHHLTF